MNRRIGRHGPSRILIAQPHRKARFTPACRPHALRLHETIRSHLKKTSQFYTIICAGVNPMCRGVAVIRSRHPHPGESDHADTAKPARCLSTSFTHGCPLFARSSGAWPWRHRSGSRLASLLSFSKALASVFSAATRLRLHQSASREEALLSREMASAMRFLLLGFRVRARRSSMASITVFPRPSRAREIRREALGPALPGSRQRQEESTRRPRERGFHFVPVPSPQPPLAASARAGPAHGIVSNTSDCPRVVRASGARDQPQTSVRLRGLSSVRPRGLSSRRPRERGLLSTTVVKC